MILHDLLKTGKSRRHHAPMPDGFTCDMCMAIVKKIEEIMQSTMVEAEIIALVSLLCKTFPAPFSTLCESVVKQYVPIIIKWIVEGIEHLEICKKIHLCSVQEAARIPIDEENGITCDVCKSFFKWAAKELEKHSVAFLWKFVNEKCPKVPYIKNFCKLINEQNIQNICASHYFRRSTRESMSMDPNLLDSET